MTHRPVVRAGLACAALILLAPATAGAQESGVEFTYGQWRPDSTRATVFTAGVFQRLTGPVSWGVGVTHHQDLQPTEDWSATGTELALAVGRDGHGPYVVASAAALVRHTDRALDGFWSAGAGWALTPLRGLSLGLEARLRAEDQAFRGFWRLGQTDRIGVVVQARLAFGIPGRGAPPRVASAGGSAPPSGGAVEPFRAPPTATIVEESRRGGASEEATRVTTSVIETALQVMGAPYRWGGTDDNGFDCSGLIQYAYREHGIILPRVSRDQLRQGTAVEPRLEQLRPGDLLGFAVEGRQVTHIGLYIGDGQFLHSASGGVRISSLTATDPDSRWWQRRWVSARRIVA